MTAEPSSQRYYYQLPTRMNVEDKLINVGPISLTLRQGFVLALGGCMAITLWRWLGVLSQLGDVGFILRIVLISLLLLLSLGVAIIRIADRHLEDWAMVLWRYAWLPKLYGWRHLLPSLRHRPFPQKGRRPRRRSGGIDEESEVG
jgi:hypothetical protein